MPARMGNHETGELMQQGPASRDDRLPDPERKRECVPPTKHSLENKGRFTAHEDAELPQGTSALGNWAHSLVMACLLKSVRSAFCAFVAVLVHPLMQLRLDAERRILLNRAEIPAKRSNSDQFRPNFRAESPAPARINMLWLRTQSNKPSLVISLSDQHGTVHKFLHAES